MWARLGSPCLGTGGPDHLAVPVFPGDPAQWEGGSSEEPRDCCFHPSVHPAISLTHTLSSHRFPGHPEWAVHLGLQDGDPTVMVSESLPRRSRPGPLSQGCSELGEGGGGNSAVPRGGWLGASSWPGGGHVDSVHHPRVTPGAPLTGFEGFDGKVCCLSASVASFGPGCNLPSTGAF